MSRIFLIATDEWRYWRRTRLAIVVLILALLLASLSAFLTLGRMEAAAHERTHLQESAEAAFLEQPDRHPHRMVHYGHYVFRTPPPLGMIDPGVDAYTGTSIFLEGHRQNSAMFAEERASGGLSVFGGLTPAFVLQVFAPLLLILIGYASVTRELEAATFRQLVAQGVPPHEILLGKGLALAGVAALMVAPLLVGAVAAFGAGEALGLVAYFLFGYFLYLLVWGGVIVLVSGYVRTGATSLGVLFVLWIALAVLLPRVASSTAGSLLPVPGKLETDFAVLAELRTVGDGHNASDPAFIKLKDTLLKEYGVDRVEDLPVNFRGVVSSASEAQLTDILNRFAEDRMQAEARQADIARAFGWLSPVLAMREFSMVVAGTDLDTHHRFLREAEAVRFDFVQGLNQAHAEQVTFADDANKGRDVEAEKRSRVSADNWRVLNDFNFTPAAADDRIAGGLSALLKLLLWFGALWAAAILLGRKTGRSQ